MSFVVLNELEGVSLDALIHGRGDGMDRFKR